MNTQRIWGPARPDRRSGARHKANFYAVELASDGSRYLRRIHDVSRDGLLLEDRLTEPFLGAVMELEVPRVGLSTPLRVRAEVVHVAARGRFAVRVLDGRSLEGAGGSVTL